MKRLEEDRETDPEAKSSENGDGVKRRCATMLPRKKRSIQRSPSPNHIFHPPFRFFTLHPFSHQTTDKEEIW
ncbi:hypothetical protein ACET3Z_011235 [Daucus carota]